MVDRRRIELVDSSVTPALIHYESQHLDVRAMAHMRFCDPHSVSGVGRTCDGIARTDPLDVVREWPVEIPLDIAVRRKVPDEAGVEVTGWAGPNPLLGSFGPARSVGRFAVSLQ